MDEIAKAFSSYASLLEHLTWLQQNAQLPPETDVGLLAFQGSIAYASPVVVEAFAATMEALKAERLRHAAAPKRSRPLSGEKAIAIQEARLLQERQTYEKARQLSMEYIAGSA